MTGRETVVQISTVTEIGDEVEVIVVLVDAVEAKNVGTTGQKVEDFGFYVEAEAVFWVVRKGMLVDGFTSKRVRINGGDGGGCVGETAVNDAESAAAELFAQLVIFLEVFA